MTKPKDWADKKVASIFWNLAREDFTQALRDAERRGYARAVKYIRQGAADGAGDDEGETAKIWASCADELEGRKADK